MEHPRRWLGGQWPGLSPWECRAARSRQARPGEAQEPTSGTAKEVVRGLGRAFLSLSIYLSIYLSRHFDLAAMPHSRAHRVRCRSTGRDQLKLSSEGDLAIIS